ncbi:MAG: ABC transporter permease [Mangrovibacterium sp.]
MKQFTAFIYKEFLHVFRDKRTLLILFGLPIMQILLFGFALNSEVKNIGITILDASKSVESQQIISRIENSEYFIVREYTNDYDEILNRFKDGSSRSALVFPADFANDLSKSNTATLQIITDGSDPNTAKTVENYITQIVSRYNQELNETSNKGYRIVPEVRQMWNEEMNGSMNFVPGVIALVFLIVCTTLTSTAIVREREMGTMEILLVSPFKPILILVAKAIPYLVLSIVNLLIILLLSTYVLDVPVRGSFLLLLFVNILFIITCLSLGLLISNLVETQQAAMMASMMGMMLPTIILTGFMFPIENMPVFFQWVSRIVPSRYFYDATKMIMLKGLGFSYIWKDVLVLTLMSAIFIRAAIAKFNMRIG